MFKNRRDVFRHKQVQLTLGQSLTDGTQCRSHQNRIAKVLELDGENFRNGTHIVDFWQMMLGIQLKNCTVLVALDGGIAVKFRSSCLIGTNQCVGLL